jgi:hypothetical protein
MNITTSQQLIKHGEFAITLFTHGDNFRRDASGNGETGNWVVDADWVDQTVDKVIIYLRERDSLINRIFVGKYQGIVKSPEQNRYIVRFSGLQEIGTTALNWLEFSKSGQNPVSYISG